MVRIHPITLQFDDDEMEQDLRSGTLDASYCVLILFSMLDILCRAVFPSSNVMFDPDVFTSKAVAYTCIAITYATVVVLLRYVRTLPRHEAAIFFDKLWMLSWVSNVAVWWFMLQLGLARRLSPVEGQGAAVCCAMWALVMVIQHTLHIGFRYRVIVMLMAISIALTSLAWRRELLASLMFGEAVGYSLEHMVRSSYLPRALSLEETRRAKERSDYDLRMLAHSRARGSTSSPGRLRDPARSFANSSRSKSKSARSTSSGSSIAELSQYALRSREAPYVTSISDGPAVASARPSMSLRQRGEEAPPPSATQRGIVREQALWRTLEASGLLRQEDEQE